MGKISIEWVGELLNGLKCLVELRMYIYSREQEI